MTLCTSKLWETFIKFVFGLHQLGFEVIEKFSSYNDKIAVIMTFSGVLFIGLVLALDICLISIVYLTIKGIYRKIHNKK